MSYKETQENLYRHKHALIFLIVGIFGFFMTRIGANSDPVIELLPAIGATIIVSALLGIVYEYYLRTEIIKMNDMSSDRVIEKLDISENSIAMGLSKISNNASEEDFSNFIGSQKNITLVLNDGRTWVSHRLPMIRKRLKNKKLKTDFILIHPDSEYLEPLGLKVGCSAQSLSNKIKETCKLLEEASSGHRTLRIYGHKLPTTQSIFICDEYAFSAPYPMATKMDHIPIYQYAKNGKDSVFDGMENDINALKDKAEILHTF